MGSRSQLQCHALSQPHASPTAAKWAATTKTPSSTTGSPWSTTTHRVHREYQGKCVDLMKMQIKREITSSMTMITIARPQIICCELNLNRLFCLVKLEWLLCFSAPGITLVYGVEVCRIMQ